jgi:hypothetical protein
MSLYEQNINALVTVNPRLAARLYGLQTNEKFDVFVDNNDVLNVNILCQNEPIYSGVARDETVERCDAFEAEYMHYPYLYFYGIGNGLLYKLLLQNSEHKKIVIIEKEIELIYIALHFNDFTKEILDKKLIIFLQEDISFGQISELYYDQAMRLYTKTYRMEIHNNFYEKHYMNDIVSINRLFIKSLENAVNAAGNDSIDALIGIAHQVTNVKKMVHTPTLWDGVKKIKNSEVAVIVATGPSLKKQLPLLKKIAEHVTILCVDSSFPILYKEGIKPDIVLSLERVVETAQFFANVPTEWQEDVVFALTSIVHPDIFKEIKGGTLHVSQRPFGYTRFFELHEYGYAGIGMSVANLAYEYAFHSKFKTIVLIGQDLAYASDGTSHSDGHIYGINDKDDKLATHEVMAYGGMGSVKTNKIWSLFKNSFEADIYHTKQEGIVTINATEGGARIEGALEIPFEQVMREYVDQNFHKQPIQLDIPESSKIEENLKKIDQKIIEMTEYVKNHQQKVEEVFLEVMQACEKFDELDIYNNLESADSEKLIYLMDEIDAIKAYFEDEEFAEIFTDSTQAMVVSLEMDLAQIQVRVIKTEDDKKRKMIDWIYAHRYWLFSLAGMMQATMDAITMGLEMSLDFEAIECVKVYIDKQEIDTLHVDHENEFMNNMADIKQMCIDYKLEEKDADKTDSLKFYYSDTQNSFQEEVHVPPRNDGNFTRFMFVNSLETTIDYKKFTKAPKAKDELFYIGLLPVKPTQENEEFIEAIQKICNSFPEIGFKFVCFNEDEIEMTKYVFSKELEHIEFIAPKNIYELYEQIDMFIYDLEKLEDKKLYGIRHILNNAKNIEVPQLKIEFSCNPVVTLQDHISEIYLEVCMQDIQGGKIAVYSDGNSIEMLNVDQNSVSNLFDLKQICYDYRRGSSHNFRFKCIHDSRDLNFDIYLTEQYCEYYNRYAISYSLNAKRDARKNLDICQENKISFLGTLANLRDNNFMEFVHSICQKYPHISLNIFCLVQDEYTASQAIADDFQNVTIQYYHSVEQIINQTEVYIHNVNTTVINDIAWKIQQIFIYECNNIMTLNYNKEMLKYTLREHSLLLMKAGMPFYDNPHYFGFDQKVINEANNNLSLLTYFGSLQWRAKKIDFDLDICTVQDMLIILLEDVFGNRALKEYSFDLHKKYKQYIEG